ncbi:hypothetical protein ACFOGI_05405 [Virgibacillus xinjiangensis]|uniref:Uncharacterized protein n=1 Tax=Virgibacillus xinjiangensis TaxID=393090 RepID=A0ABV7CTA3_9BACI
MDKGNPSKLEKWREKYAALVVASTCFISLINSWGNNWVLTGILGLGVLVCGTIGVFDIKRAIQTRNRF